MILKAYRHGLRACEVVGLEWHQVELDQGRLHVRRAKNGTPSVHPIQGDEIRALRRLRRENPSNGHVFISGPPSALPNSSSGLVIASGMPFPIHPHMHLIRSAVRMSAVAMVYGLSGFRFHNAPLAVIAEFPVSTC
jgi:integrase